MAPAPAHSAATPAELVSVESGLVTVLEGSQVHRYVQKSGKAAGWEATCRFSAHAGAGQLACKRSRFFSRHGGPEMTERILKSWAVGASPWHSRDAHLGAEECQHPRSL